MEPTQWTKTKVYKSIIMKNLATFINLMITNFSDVIIALIFPWLLKILIDVSFYNRDIELFYRIIISIIILFVCRLLIFLIMDLSWNYLRMQFNFFVAKKTYEKVLKMKPDNLLKYSKGDLIERINHDGGRFWEQFYWSGVYLIVPVLYIVFTTAILFYMDYKIAIILILITFLSIISSRFLGNKIKALHKILADQNAGYISLLYNILSGFREIIMFTAQNFMTKKFVSRTIKLTRMNINISKKEFIFNRSNSFLRFLSTIITYIVCAVAIFNGNITLGAFVAITQYVAVINTNFDELIEFILSYKKNNVIIDRVFDVWNLANNDIETGLDFPEDINSIQFVNVCFKYENGPFVLRDFNLTIYKGQKVAITGKSGIGKSTLLNLIIRLYDPDSGDILINGISNRKYSLKSLRDNVGIIFQEPFLFNDTIEYNVQNNSTQNNEVLDKLDQANILNYIMTLPNGIKSKIGNDEIKFSRGQMQRIVIARILNRNPKIILADEATVSIDEETESEIFNIINEKAKDNIIISITHQISSMINSDLVAVMRDGKIVACAPYEEIKSMI